MNKNAKIQIMIHYTTPARGIMGFTARPRDMMAAQGLERKARMFAGNNGSKTELIWISPVAGYNGTT
jgi:hypothetical protein